MRGGWKLSMLNSGRDETGAGRMLPLISVVIPSYQRCAAVARLLPALARQTLPTSEYEVIVSIDGSQDGTRELVAQFAAPYRLRALWQPNRGRAAACNAGIQAAAGETVVLLDDDMEPAPDCLAQHARAHPPDSRLGVMGAVPIGRDESASPVAAYIADKFNAHLAKLEQSSGPLALRDFYSGHFSIRRAILLEVGGFDEDFKAYGNEDLELSLRLRQAGVTLIYLSAAVAYQHYTKGFAALAHDTIAKGRTSVLLGSKHPEALAELRLSAYTQVSRKWRGVRAGLLGLSRLWSGTPDAVIRGIGWLEGRRSARLGLYYQLALDYFYWLGAFGALRDNRRAGQGMTALPHRIRS